jgi:hypothetical protein
MPVRTVELGEGQESVLHMTPARDPKQGYMSSVAPMGPLGPMRPMGRAQTRAHEVRNLSVVSLSDRIGQGNKMDTSHGFACAVIQATHEFRTTE